MYADVYIGLVKSEEFDYDEKGNDICYLPTPAMPRPGIDENKVLDGERDLYWVIWGYPGGKQVEWGCYVIKMPLQSIIEFLAKDKFCENEFAKYLAMRAKELLDPEKEYLLVAVEG